jgi:hypothetical protein
MSIARAVSIGCVTAVLGLASSVSNPAWAQGAHRCAPAAREQAQKLLAFHAGGDDRIQIDKSVRTLLPMRNPANRLQRFDVLEVWGRIYKGQYQLAPYLRPYPERVRADGPGGDRIREPLI